MIATLSEGPVLGTDTRSLGQHGAFLRVVVPGEPSRDLKLGDAGEVVIGRDASLGDDGQGLPISHPTVSNRHARLRWDGDSVTVEDLGSRHGTRVNGYKIPGRYELLPGDDVLLGEAEIQFRCLGSPGEPASEQQRSRQTNEQVDRIIHDVRATANAIIRDTRMCLIFQRLKRLAGTNLPIIIGGESGVGKEIAAAVLHKWSKRAGMPFRAVNCAALSDTIVESELFGHARGAFTNATENKKGLFTVASGGTLFLDEVGTLSLGTQAKLLRALEKGVITPVGDIIEVKVNVRVIAATNENLLDKVKKTTFREDLLSRLAGDYIVIPPLRTRVRDISPLAEGFMTEACRELGRDQIVISSESHHMLQQHDWPRNVRELSMFIRRMAIFCEGNLLAPHEVLKELKRNPFDSSDGTDRMDAPTQEPAQLASEFTGDIDLGYEENMDRFGRELIQRALTLAKGNKSEAARLLHINRQRLYERMKQLGMER